MGIAVKEEKGYLQLMPYNSDIHHRRSIRLKGYDYAQEGLYFITICCYNRLCHFGNVVNGEMVMNGAGAIVNQCWHAIPEHFPNVVLHEYIVMPNHLHGIIQLVGAKKFSPDNDQQNSSNRSKSIIPDNAINHPLPDDKMGNDNGAKDISPLRSPSKTVGSIVRGFKIGVTKWMRQNTDVQNVWQRNYYEHIIRDERSYRNIAHYIINNPMNWKGDKFYM